MKTKKEQQANEPVLLKDIKTVNIEDADYTYMISQLEKEEGISIKLTEAKPIKNINFTYNALKDKIAKDIKPLRMCENIDEMITTLKEIFDVATLKVDKKEEKYILIIEVTQFGKLSIYQIELEKNEPVDESTAILQKLKELDLKFNEIEEKMNKLKDIIKKEINEEFKKDLIKEIKEELNIKENIKEIIKSKEIKEILFKEFEERLSNKYIKKEEKQEEDKLINEKIEESINKRIDDKCKSKVDENKFNENINKIKEDINKYIKDINEIKKKDIIIKEINKNINENEIIKNLNKQMNTINNKIKDNYITLKIEINKYNINRDILLINQCSTYKLFKNFELDDIIVEINEERVPIKYKHNFGDKFFKYCSKLSDSEQSQKIYNEMNNNYSFYWNFDKEGIYNIKIIFKKQLTSCAGMFYHCNYINEIDLSKFDCTKVLSCESMFFLEGKIRSHLTKIDLGKLDFSLVNNFSNMFCYCRNLIDLDVSNFNTQNSKSFAEMFFCCEKLKKIDVSKFNSSKCENISGMFGNCSELEEIDMINLDMSNLKYENIDGNINPINGLFCDCKKLKKIKISGNIKKEEANKGFEGYIFNGVPENGELIMSKKVKCNIPLDGYLPSNWDRHKE